MTPPASPRDRVPAASGSPGPDGGQDKAVRSRWPVFAMLAAGLLVFAVVMFRGQHAALPAADADTPPTAAPDTDDPMRVGRPVDEEAQPAPTSRAPARFPGLAVPDQPVSGLLPDLRERAERDDAAAALELFSLLYYCRPADPARMSPEALQALPADVRETMLRGAGKQLDLCRDVTAGDLDETYAWLDRAARLGDAHAQYLYAAMGAEVVGGLQAVARDEALLADYTSRARGYLATLARACVPDAVHQLHRAHAGAGILYPPDDYLALLYGRLGQLMAPTPLGEQSLAPLADRLGPRAARAAVEAARLHAAYCR